MLPAYRNQVHAILRTDFLSFAYWSFSKLHPNDSLSKEWIHEEIAALLTRKTERLRAIVNAPPRSLKSFLISAAWPAYKLGIDPTHRFICGSYSQKLANSIATTSRNIMEADWYQEVFLTRLDKSTEDELATTQGGCRLAVSVGGTLTGLGGDTLIIDDPLNAPDALSDVTREGANHWFDGTLMSRLNNKAGGRVIVVQQRLHEHDLTGHLLEKGGWDCHVYPAIAQEDTPIILPNRSFTWRKDEPLQQRENLDTLARVQSDTGYAEFQAHYLQRPVPDQGNDLKREWLKWYETPPNRQPGDLIVQSCDTAIKATRNADYSTLLTFLVRGSAYFLIDVWREKVEFPDLCLAVAQRVNTNRPNAVVIEEHAMGVPLILELKRQTAIDCIIPMRPKKDKRSRMSGQTPKLQAGSLVLPNSAPWLGDFMVEYLSFPSGKTDDMIDALSQFLEWRDTAGTRIMFEADFGYNDPGSSGYGSLLGAPSPAQMLEWLR